MGTSRGIPQRIKEVAPAPDLHFQIHDAEALPYAASPHIAFKLRITTSSPLQVHSVMLHCQVQLDVALRHYTPSEQQPLQDVFGEPDQWARTVRSMLWTNVTAIIPAFTRTIDFDLQVPCTFDFNIAATKYFAALAEGEVPLSFYFNGTVFYQGPKSTLQVTPISWEKESAYRMPVQTWQRMMEAFYPNSTWLRLNRDAFDRLNAFKIKHGLPTFEQAIEKVIP